MLDLAQIENGQTHHRGEGVVFERVFAGNLPPFFDISSGARADGSYPTRMMGGAMSAYWFMYDAAALPSLGAKPRTLP
jgi:hypothetical protein